MKKIYPIIVVLIFAAIAAAALFTHKFIPTHDGEYHIIRFWQFYKMISKGHIVPRWAPDLNSGYGLPLFIFHYPFPNYIGALFHQLGFGFVDAFKLTLAAGYISAVCWCYLWLRTFSSKFGSASATIIFAYVPYWFVDIYVRGSVGEVLAISFVMLALCAIERRWRHVVAFAVLGIIISHNITALITLPLLCAYALFRRKNCVQYIAFGVFAASYFWLPALFEAKYMVGLNSVNFIDHFPDLYQLLIPSWGTGFSGPGMRFDQMSFQIGVVPLIVFLLSLWMVQKAHFRDRAIVSALIVYAVVLYCMTGGSTWVWRLIPILQYVQYPWRLLTILLVETAVLAAYIADKIPKWMTGVLVVAAVYLSFGYTHPVMYEPRSDAHYITNPNFTDGTSSLGNSLSTIWTGWKKIRSPHRFTFDVGDARYTMRSSSPLRYVLEYASSADSTFTAHILYFPGWKIHIDDKDTEIIYQKDGIMHASVPKGNHVIEVVFEKTPIRTLADALTLISLFCVFGSGILSAVYAYRAKQLTTYFRTQGSRSRHIHKRTHSRTAKRS